MAGTIAVTSKMVIVNGNLSVPLDAGRVTITQVTGRLFDVVRAITTTEVSVALTGITTPRVCRIYNLDATNYVEWGTATTVHPFRLYPASCPHTFELNTTTTTLYLKANTATCNVWITVGEL